ncbi:MAG: cytochrome c biogenesis protein CcsA [Prevotella sp.]|nr:cytochrome c biogenesis protein CcsA [Prevotella sp.]
MKKTLYTLYIVVVAVMAAATIVEKYQGTQFVSDNIYGAWWFSLLWGLLAAVAVWWFVKRRVRRFHVVILHLSFLIILLGALLTHLTARRGAIHLREGESTNTYVTEDMQQHALPFTIRLDRFDITYHPGTTAPADYASHVTIGESSETISMNHIAAHSGIRLYQSGYDPDGHGTILALNSDPWGIPVTYTGYALLFFALIWMLIDPKGTYRQLLRSPLLKRSTLLLIACCWLCSGAAAAPKPTPPALPAETAARLGRLNMLYNDRICPVQTYALDFTKKLYGKRSYEGLTAEQVLTGFIFWPDEWRQQPVIKVKSGALKETLQLPGYCSVNTFFNATMGGYILGPYVEEYYRGQQQDAFHKDVAKMDDRLMLVMELGQGTPLRLFPYTTAHGVTTWHAPVGKLPADIDNSTQQFIKNLFHLLTEEVRAGHYDEADRIIDKLAKFQHQHGGTSIPTATQLKAEYIYNKVPFATILFMVNLTMGFLTMALFIWLMRRKAGSSHRLFSIAHGLLYVVLAALTTGLMLRWIITGHVPMANGYETMLTLAWLIIVLSLIAYRRFPIALTFGYLLSGFFLLVSHISQMDPQIGHLMPVLNSPLLSLHVSIIMTAFALLAMTFMCGVTALMLPVMREQLQLLSRLFLYPALTTLGLGIFIGAIWANISWGTYWSWDPKETWALITFMVYAVVVHTQSLPVFQRPLAYHVYITLAFLTILMTYFGVNYFLGGMHAYA